MSDYSGPSPFHALFESALQDYEKQTGIPLANHPLAEQIQNCQSVESVTALLREQTQALNELRGSDKMMKSLDGVVSALSKVSATATLAIGTLFPPADAIYTGLGILFTAFKDVTADLDVLVDLIESIEHFLKRLDIYNEGPPAPAMTEIVVKIMVELLSALALATKQITQGRPKKFIKKLFGENGIEAVLQRLDRLTQDEARATAAQTLRVIYGLVQNMRVVMDDGEASADNVRDALEILQEMASEMNKSKSDKLQQDIQSWLSPPDPWKNQNIACESRHTGTAAWFVGGSTLSEWKSSGPSSLLWIHGKPGAGKSVLCSTIIENVNLMKKTGLASLAFFYCDFREDEKRELPGLLSSVLVQLCHQSDSFCHILSGFYSEHANGLQHPSNDALKQCLKDILEVPGQAPVYLIVDGLDECSSTSAMPSPREKVLMLLEDLIYSHIPNLRICVASRPESDIKAVLEPLTFHSISLHEENGQMEDIDNYIRSVVSTDPRMRRWNAADKELVIDVLIKKSDGMFRWVYCQIVYLRRCLPGRIRHALDELPETLDETYERALREIDKTNWEFAYRLLQYVAVAFRPLRVAELAEILSFDFKTGPIPKFHEGWRLGDPIEAVLSTTSSLLVVVDDWDSPVVQFSHFSVKEFLTSARLAETNDSISRRYHISMTPAHTLAAQACLSILLHMDQNVVSEDSLENYPLAEYAAKHWVDHARFEGVSGNVEDGMKRLFDPDKQHLAIWLWIYDPELGPWNPTSQADMLMEPRGSHLHYAAVCGIHAIVMFLVIQHSQDVHSRGFDDDSTPLHVSSRQGHEDITRLLLEYGADINAQTNDGSSPLHLASQFGHEDVARSLLENGADSTARTNDGSTPLHLASQWGHEDIARSLLEHGADTTAQTDDGSTPLHLASQWRSKGVACMLLEQRADTTAQTNDGLTPLHLASQWGHEDVARLLLEHGTDTTAQTNDGLTPLHLALKWGNNGVTRLLLEHGADSKAQDKDGWTPLHFALEDEEVACLLLEYGADTTAQTNDGSTPLHLASQRGHDAVARLLLKHRANSRAQDKDGQTPLHSALQNRHKEVARLLLEHGTDITAQTNDGSTPLHLASRWGRGDVARLLLEHGADPTAPNKDGWTPLHLASQWECDVVVRLLLEHGADATAQTKDGSTPLHLSLQWERDVIAHLLLELGADAIVQADSELTVLHTKLKWDCEEIARSLLDHGADATVQNKDGWTPLHLASRWGHDDVARMLLEHGADSTVRNKDGWTPLHLASQWEREVVARLLLEHGADPNAQINDGSTPLHLVSQWEHEVAARLLLELGLDPKVQTKDGSTPLHPALQWEYEIVARLLVEHGADATAQSKDGSSPLHVALKSGYGNVALLLIEQGADPTAQTKDGSTPVHLAVRFGHAEVVQFFFERGADLTVQKKDGSTLLHLASRWGHVEVTGLLIAYGVDATTPNEHGWTALHLASRWGHVEVSRLLLDHGTDVTAQNNYGSTPSHLALQAGHVEVARLLVERGADMTDMDDQVATPWQVALHLEDMELAHLFERDADAIA